MVGSFFLRGAWDASGGGRVSFPPLARAQKKRKEGKQKLGGSFSGGGSFTVGLVPKKKFKGGKGRQEPGSPRYKNGDVGNDVDKRQARPRANWTSKGVLSKDGSVGWPFTHQQFAQNARSRLRPSPFAVVHSTSRRCSSTGCSFYSHSLHTSNV